MHKQHVHDPFIFLGLLLTTTAPCLPPSLPPLALPLTDCGVVVSWCSHTDTDRDCGVVVSWYSHKDTDRVKELALMLFQASAGWMPWSWH